MSMRVFLNKLTNTYRHYDRRLLAMFPTALRNEVLAALSTIPLYRHSVRLVDGRVRSVDDLIHEKQHILEIQDEVVQIPSRLYFDEPDEGSDKELTDREKVILDCVYLRHHNGYVRQRHLESLVNRNDYFICPFGVQLLGEYVVEILQVLDQAINPETIDHYVAFIKANPVYWSQTQSRMVSYWDVYYRDAFPLLDNYIGKRLVNRLNKAVQASY